MNIRQTVHIPRRVLSLALCAAMVLALLPLPARAEGICAHHPEHTADCGYKAAVEGQNCSHSHDDSCGYQEASPCTHSHDASCGYREASNCTHQHTEECGGNGESCTHSHDGSCGYQEAENCTHSHDDACGYREARSCTHVHNDTCGYVEAVAGSPCTYQCEICAQQASQQQNGQDLCTHGNESAACETCASEKKVTEVQALINALPETVTEENREAAQSALSAVDTAKAALTEAEQAKLTLTRYTALKALLAEPETPDTGKVITAWEWIEDEELAIIDPETGLAHLPFTSPERIAYFEDVAGLLPVAILADGEELTLGDWLCPDYPMESGAYEGEYVFKTTLPEGYTLPDGTNVLRLAVVLGDPEGEPVATLGFTLEEPGTGTFTIGIDENVTAYKLSTPGHLYWFAQQINEGKNYNAVLMNDIEVNKDVLDADGNLNTGSFELWTPIGYSDHPFGGKFDGRGYAVSGLYVNGERTTGTGFFGMIRGSARIYRVGVEDSYFKATNYVGGFCGGASDSPTIKNCYTTATVQGEDTVAGFCASAVEPIVDSCFCTGKVSSTGSADSGLFFKVSSKNATNCYVLDTEEKTDGFGVAHKTAAQFASGEVAYLLNKFGSDSGFKQNIGTDTIPRLSGKIVYSTIHNEYHNHNDGITHCLKCGEVALSTGSYYIKTKDQLYWFAALVNGSDGLTPTPNAKASILENITVESDWVPIGCNTSFTGGIASSNNRTISGIPAGSSLFGTIGSGVTVEKLAIPSGSLCKDNLGTIKSCTASGGALVSGSNSGTITDCTASGGALVGGSNSGTIIGCTASGGKLVGGSNNSGGTVTSCSVTGTGSAALIADSNSGTIAKSYAKGGAGASLCQTNNSGGKITNCYATATSGSAKLCGSNAGTIANCYAAGDSGTVLCGGNTSGVTNCYYLAGTSASTVGGTALTTASPFASGEVAYRLNTDDCWGQTLDTETLPLLGSKTVYYTENENRGYHNHNGYCTDCKKLPTYENRVWQIKDADDLYWFAQYVNGEFELPNDLKGATYDARLMNDITVNSGVLKPDGSLSDNAAGFAQWTPIGNSSNQYKGTFDGNNHTISGLYVNTPETYHVGLFGCIYTATLKDLTIADSYLCGGMETGAVCGWIQQGSTVSNCHNTGTVVGTDYVGGVAGSCGGTSDNSTTITDCSNSGNVSGDGCVGGVCGLAEESTTISNCTNSGDVRGSSDVGGVCGDCGRSNRTGTATVSNCTNSGMVSGSYLVGGVCGEVYTNGTVSNCANSGKVSGGSSGSIGGVCGNNKGSVESCYNTGEVSGSNNTGGVCGNSSGTITNCYYDKDKYTGNAIGSGTGTNVEGKTTKEFASGEVAYLLNGGSSSGIWKQNIDVGTPDATPNFAGAAVYQAKSGACYPGYTNNASGQKNHVFEDHICIFCSYRDQYPITVTGVTAKDKTYDGTTSAELVLTFDGKQNTYPNVSVTATGTFANANVGTGKTVTIKSLQLTGTDANKYYLADPGPLTATASITAKSLSDSDITVTATDLTYTGSQQSPTVTVEYGTITLQEGTDYTLSGNTATNADNYTLTVTGIGNYTGTVNRTFSIEKANSSVSTAPAASGLTYSGQAQTLIIAGSTSHGTLVYSLTQDGTYEAALPTGTNADSYTVWYKIIGDSNHLDSAPVSVDCSIAQKALTVKAKDHTITYGDAPANNGVTYDGFVNEETESVLGGTLDYTYTYSQYGNVGSNYTITPKGLTSGNYNITFAPGKLTVQKKEIGIAWGDASLPYTGTAQAPTATATGLVNSDTCDITVTGQQTDVGENYTATATTLSSGNYKLPENHTCTFSITKVAPTFTAPTGKTVVYTGKALELTEGAETSHGTMQYRLGEEGEWTVQIPTATDCGTYTVYYKVVGDNNHNDTEAWTLTAKIVPFRIHSQPHPDSEEIRYGTSIKRSVGLQTNVTEGISYQWCLVTREDGNKEIFTPLEGETGKELTLTKPNAGKYEYACIVTCGDYSETSAKATVTVTPVEIPAGPGTGIDLSGFWLEGGEAPASENQTKIPEKSPSSRLLTKYTYNGTSNDAHQNYPTGMQIYSVETDDQGNTTVAPVAELGNLLRYSGCSIRITGKPGIRMITSLTKEAKAALTKANLAGYTLEEYGTVAVWSSDLDNQPLTLNTKKSRSNYAYKRGVSDPVFANVGALTQYTNVLVWDSLEDKKYDEDIVMRPYIKLSKGGETVTLYGGTVSRSIGYVAQQNANTFAKGTAGYKYVHEIIDKVNALNSSTGTNTTTGGNG